VLHVADLEERFFDFASRAAIGGKERASGRSAQNDGSDEWVAVAKQVRRA